MIEKSLNNTVYYFLMLNYTTLHITCLIQVQIKDPFLPITKLIIKDFPPSK